MMSDMDTCSDDNEKINDDYIEELSNNNATWTPFPLFADDWLPHISKTTGLRFRIPESQKRQRKVIETDEMKKSEESKRLKK